MRRLLPASLGIVLLAGCATTPPHPAPAPAAAPALAPPPMPKAGLDRVIGHDAANVIGLFGEPDLDLREPGARKLQFRSAICVLDVYFYAKAGAAPLATYVDARTAAGDDMDRASCIAALSRRREAR